MTRRSIKALQERLTNESKESGSNSGFYYPHWKLPKDGMTKIRILEDPDQENPLVVYTDYMEHVLHINDEITRVPCVKNNGKEQSCPICEMSQKFYKAKNDDRGKYFYRDMYALLRGLVTKDGLEYGEDDEPATGTIKIFKFSYQLATKLKSEIGKLDEEDVFWDLDDGLDFIIEKQIQLSKGGKEFAKYDLGSGFVRKSTKIGKDWREEITDEPLSALIPDIPSYDEADELLQRYLKAEFNGGSSDDDKTESEDELMDKINRNRRAKSESKTSTRDDDDDDADTGDDGGDKSPLDSIVEAAGDDGDDDGDILAQLRGED
jgi:hypothetical protein